MSGNRFKVMARVAGRLISRGLSQPKRKERAVVLLSGGLDSATVLAMALAEGRLVTTLSFDYNQRHRHELEAAALIAQQMGVTDHRIGRIDGNIFQGSSLTDKSMDVPKSRIGKDRETTVAIPSTYVPARNTIFLSLALAVAEGVHAREIHIGANVVDYSGYPDCRPEFFEAFDALARVATRAGVQSPGNDAPVIRTPLLKLSKKEIIQKGLQLGVDFSVTHSCYDPAPSGRPCTKCDACILRADAFSALGFAEDPAVTLHRQTETHRVARTNENQ